jgi:hypothetical protein
VKSSGGTAIAAGAIAIIVGIFSALRGVAGLLNNSPFKIIATAFAVTAVILLVGAVLVFMRKPTGRMLVIAGCILVMVAETADVLTSPWTIVVLSLLLILPAVALVLAAVPPSARWCAAAGAPRPVPPGHGGAQFPGG